MTVEPFKFSNVFSFGFDIDFGIGFYQSPVPIYCYSKSI